MYKCIKSHSKIAKCCSLNNKETKEITFDENFVTDLFNQYSFDGGSSFLMMYELNLDYPWYPYLTYSMEEFFKYFEIIS